MKNLADFRKEYSMDKLEESHLPENPLWLFDQWLEDAISKGVPEPNAMTLATVTPEGRASARVLLLKEVRDEAFVFYTNYQSQKGKDLEANPHATLVFLWLDMQRQVRISGLVNKVSPEESDAYFAVRPRNSQISAVISPQGKAIIGREELENAFYEAFEKHRDAEIKRPEHWGGYAVKPESIEFWQGRESRLHDRILYSRKAGEWAFQRLAP